VDLAVSRRVGGLTVRVLVLNAGSSSLKLSVIEGARTLLQTSVAVGSGTAEQSVAAALAALAAAAIPAASIGAIGHRVVHGGSELTAATIVDEGVLATIDRLDELAPLHNRVAVAMIRAAQAALPELVQVACFDTALHTTLPESMQRYPVPAKWRDAWGIRRYGFHGLSVQWASERAGELLGRDALELVVAHLGSGSSVTAMSRGVSVATSMGFTPLEGLMMGTRSGSIDPGIVLHLLRSGRLELAELADALEHRSGLRGVSGSSADVRELERAADAGDDAAALALAMFVDRAAQGIAAAATALPRLDALVFTGGIGEHAGRVRAAIVERLAVLGLPRIPSDETGDDRVLARARGESPAVLRIEAREDLVIARAVQSRLPSW
jgi:acetate kinase